MIVDLIHNRQLLLAFLERGFKTKYKNSYLGIFWSLLNPLANVLIFTLVFTVFIKINIKEYPLFLLCTILPWTFFHAALTNGLVSIVEDAHFVKNAAFPTAVIPFAVVGVNLVNFLLELLMLMPVLIVWGNGISTAWIFLPLLIFLQTLLVAGLTLLAAALFVFLRDLNFIMHLGLRLFFYIVPAVYTIDFVPKHLRFFYFLNPLAVLIDGYSSILMHGHAPSLSWLSFTTVEIVLITYGCALLFKKMRFSIAERI